jgi:hypothetical protein
MAHVTFPVRSGWLSFAGMLGILLGALNVVEGLVALIYREYFVIHGGRVLIFNFTAWGWILLVLGLILVATGVGILTGQIWARMAGIGLAFLACIGHFLVIGAYPLWSIIAIVIGVLVIYGLITAPGDATG